MGSHRRVARIQREASLERLARILPVSSARQRVCEQIERDRIVRVAGDRGACGIRRFVETVCLEQRRGEIARHAPPLRGASDTSIREACACFAALARASHAT